MTVKVLIADDSGLARTMARRALRSLDIAIEEAGDGTEALAVCKQFEPDVMLLDLNMPGLSGFQVLEALGDRPDRPEVVVVSAQIQPQAMKRARRLGAAAFLRKPINADQMTSLVAHLRDRAAHPGEPAIASPARSGAYSQEEFDALAELVNVGMGRAAAVLAELIGEYVELSIPRTSLLAELIARWKQERRTAMLVTQQAFFGDVHGEVITLFCADEVRSLRRLMGESHADDEDIELLLDVTNILNGACLGSIAGQLRAKIQYCRPSVLATELTASELEQRWEQHGCHLAIDISVFIESRGFSSDVLVILPPEVDQRVRDAVAALIAA